MEAKLGEKNNMKPTAFMVISLLMFVSGNFFTEGKVYYDIDFSSPEHTVGQPPAVGTSITTLSKIVFGEPLVVDSMDNLQDQPLEFNTLGNNAPFYYDQIMLDMNDGNDLYYVSFKIETQNLLSSTNQFTVFFDTPNVRSIRFSGNGICNIFENTPVSFQDNELLHFEALFDISQKHAIVHINGIQHYNGSLGSVSYLRTIRFSLGLSQSGDSPDHTTNVGIDDIYISDEPPESCKPTANAGKDNFFFADSNDIAEVFINGSGSYDPNNRELFYHWSWILDGNSYEVNGVDPVIYLPPGKHTLKLVASNGLCYSEPDYVTIDVYDSNFKRYNVYIGRGNTPDYYVNNLAAYLRSLPDINLTCKSSVMPSGLTNYDMYMACDFDDTPYSESDINSIANYILSGGRVLFFTDHTGPGGSGIHFDPYLNALLPQLGSAMSLKSSLLDGGGHHDTIPDQISSDSFTQGVGLINYAAVNSINGGVPLLFAKNLKDFFLAYEIIGEGYLFLSGDFNLTDRANQSNFGYDNGKLFYNLIVANRNTKPIAIAGSNQVAYVCSDDALADVTLDGSGSYDDNNDILDYYWLWIIDGNVYEANGVSPTIKLPVGEYEIELVVDDGIDFSEPDYCTITVVGPLRAKTLCIPSFINTHSRRRTLTTVIYMPQGIIPEDINTNEPLVFICDSNKVESSRQFVFEWNRYGRTRTWILAWFDKDDCMDIMSPGYNKIKVTGRLNTGRCYYGNCHIYVYKPMPFRRFRKFQQ